MTAKCKYHEGQAVEVYATTFTGGQYFREWRPATVLGVEARDDGMFNVYIQAYDGAYHHQIVGRRGGNRILRPVD